MMRDHYLFVHFREKDTPDGEQVYFALSRDGFHWESVAGGRPVLWAYYGDKGVRDFTVIRDEVSGKFRILATDLSLSYGMRNQYHQSWDEISAHGSRCLSMWESEDLVNWSEQKLLHFDSWPFGCMWAPDVLYDRRREEFMLHFSASTEADGWHKKAIYRTWTKDFAAFSEPKLLYGRKDASIIDSAMYEEDGAYYLFVKSETDPVGIALYRSSSPEGDFERMEAFGSAMDGMDRRYYEAPTAVKLTDGRWCLFMDFFGVKGEGQGYVPFISEDIRTGVFRRSDSDFSFPYGFKHGTVLAITEEEYNRMKVAID